MTAGDLVARADRALMYAKRSGRRGEVLTEADLPPVRARPGAPHDQASHRRPPRGGSPPRATPRSRTAPGAAARAGEPARGRR